MTAFQDLEWHASTSTLMSRKVIFQKSFTKMESLYYMIPLRNQFGQANDNDAFAITSLFKTFLLTLAVTTVVEKEASKINEISLLLQPSFYYSTI